MDGVVLMIALTTIEMGQHHSITENYRMELHSIPAQPVSLGETRGHNHLTSHYPEALLGPEQEMSESVPTSAAADYREATEMPCGRRR
ncbi:unnamed protein product [Lota lota]